MKPLLFKFWSALIRASGYACLAASAPVAIAADFTAQQTTLFAVPGSLANAWADMDGDGDLDFAVSTKGGEIRLYENLEGRFESIGEAANLPLSGDDIRGLSWGDFDNDGDLDLFAGSSTFPMPSRSYLYQNNGDRTFSEIAEQVGAGTPGRFSRQANWIDYDQDGDLDLYAANRSGLNLLLNNENGHFRPVGFATGVFDVRRTVGACWLDFDSDGDVDLFLANQSGDSDALYRNDGERFVDVAPQLNIHQTHRGQKEGGVGCAVGDYDNDGDFDLFVATYGGNHLYRNEGNGRFTDVGEAMGVAAPQYAVGAAWGDYDNDGWLDLAIAGYARHGGEQKPLVKLYRNLGNRFEDVADQVHALQVGDHGVEWIDYDNDGDLDLSLTDGYGNEGGHFLLRNNLPEVDRTNSLAVTVLDANGHATTAGAEVRLIGKDGDVVASRIVSSGGGYNTQSVVPLYFSLPAEQTVHLEVDFKNGGAVQRIDDVKGMAGASRALTVRQRK